jgi:hypothetical protein
MNSALRAFYVKTVTPITCISVVVTVYSSGYSNGVELWFDDNKRLSFVPFVLDLAQSAVIGSCIGITYPVSIPAMVTYEYMDYRKYHKENKTKKIDSHGLP